MNEQLREVLPEKQVLRSEWVGLYIAVGRILSMGDTYSTLYEITGPFGIGKSTFVSQLEQKNYGDRCSVVSVDLNPRANARVEDYLADPTELVIDLVGGLAQSGANVHEIEAKLKSYQDDALDHGPDDQSEAVEPAIQCLEQVYKVFGDFVCGVAGFGRHMSEAHPVVFIFDSTDEIVGLEGGNELLDVIEHFLINPLSLMGKVIFVWVDSTGRRWTQHEVRQRRIEVALEGMKHGENQDLLHLHCPDPERVKDHYDDIQSVTWGHPLGNLVVIDELNRWLEQGIPESIDPRAQLVHVLNEEFVPMLLGGLDEEMREALRYCSIPRVFDFVLGNEIGDGVIGDSINQIIEDIRDRQGLVRRLRLVEWSDRSFGYRVNLFLRSVVNEHMMRTSPDEYLAHQDRLIEQYQTHRDQYQYLYEPARMVIYHVACRNRILALHGRNGIESVVAVSRREIEKIKQKHDDPDFVAHDLRTLLRLLSTDYELRERIDDQEYYELIQNLQSECEALMSE